eukprot:2394894-Rhodomonas_salina.1
MAICIHLTTLHSCRPGCHSEHGHRANTSHASIYGSVGAHAGIYYDGGSAEVPSPVGHVHWQVADGGPGLQPPAVTVSAPCVAPAMCVRALEVDVAVSRSRGRTRGLGRLLRLARVTQACAATGTWPDATGT